MENNNSIFDCLIVGAGHAGIYCAKLAKDYNINALVVERDSQVGASWMKRPPNLELFTPRFMSSLPGFNFDGNQQSYPSCREMQSYLEEYSLKHDISCRFHSEVTSMKKADNYFVTSIGNREEVYSRSVIVANGSNQVPVIPKSLSASLSSLVRQRNSESYWLDPPNEKDNILVVGDGASGRQIAAELSKNGHSVSLSVSGRNVVNGTVLGRSIFFWLDKLGILRADRDSAVAKFLRLRNPVPNKETLGNKNLKKYGVVIKSKLKSTSNNSFNFSDNTSCKYDYVVWSIGYEEESKFLLPLINPIENNIAIDRGKTSVDGLFVIGRKWLHNRASELIMGIEEDANITINLTEEYLKSLKSK